MALEFELPDIGEGLVEATVVKWHVAVGDRVALDETLVEMETDKAVVEIPAPRAGVVLAHGAAEGAVVEVDEVLVVIGDEGEQWPPDAAGDTAEGPATEEGEASPAASAARVGGDAAPIVGTLDEEETGAAVRALPLVRKLAADAGVDLGSVAGTGPGGRITRRDVEDAAGAGPEEKARGPVERVRLSPTRIAIARNLSRSWKEIPHVVTYGEADAAPLLDAKRRLEAGGTGVPLEALLIERITPLLTDDFPEFNASLDGSHLLVRRHYDIGFAIDTPEGLMVAVVKGADGRDATDLGREITRLAAAARTRAIRLEELQGATFTISNIGAVGGAYGTPIIPFGTTAILSVGRADPRPVVDGDRVAVGRRFPLSLSYDHRVVDGALGRRFMAAVVEALEKSDG